VSTEPTQEAAFFSTIRSWGIVRSDTRVLGGVLAGVGNRVGMAPVPARLIFVLIAIFTGGLALLAYAAAWALLPDAEGSIVIQDFGRGRPNVGSLVVIGILTLFGFIFLDNAGLFRGWGWWGNVDVPTMGMDGFGTVARLFILLVPLALLAGVVVLIVWAVRNSQSRDRTASGYARLPDGSLPAMPDAAAQDAPAVTDPAAVADEPTVADASSPLAEPAPPVYAAVPAPPVYQGKDYSFKIKPRLVGPGKVGYLLALAWIPITIAITLYLVTNDRLAVFPVVAGGVIYVAGLGVILIITALRGRKLGFLGFISVLALIPVGVAIGTAPELREHYAAGDWRDWVRSNGIGNQDTYPEVTYTPPPAFDPSSKFLDYETVAISGSCYEEPDLTTQETEGTVRLTSVPADQTITVTSNSTRLVIPEGTSLRVVVVEHPMNNDMGWTTQADIRWPDRDVTCTTSYGATDAVTLVNSDAPVLTVRLDDTQQMGNMSLWIEEN